MKDAPPSSKAEEAKTLASAGRASYCTEERLAVCGAYCCHIGFHLTVEEVRSGIAKWHPDFPYHILQAGDDGRCVHLDPVTLRCLIYADRPQACRNFDCRREPNRMG